MLVMADLDEPYLPAPDDMLVNLHEAREAIDSLLDSLPTMFAGTQHVESATGPALQAAFMVINHIGGKLALFQVTVPSLGVGKIKNRDNNSLYGTDREYTLRVPDDPFWKKYAAEASRQQISVDVYSFGANYADLASLGALPKYTCGSLYYYPGFNAARDAAKLEAELTHNLTRETGWEAVMRIRCSKGLRISQFHGHFFIRSSDLLALPAVDPDKAFAVQISHEETMVAYIQAALLYTASCGERRIRVATTMVPIVQELSELYRATDGAAQAALMARLAVEKSLGAKLDEARTDCQQRLVAALKEFRILQAQVLRASGGMHNQLLYPDTLKFLPVWTLGILKSSALRGSGSTVQSDERSAIAHEIMAAGVPALLRLIYPSVYLVSDPAGDWGKQGPVQGPGETNSVVLPATVPASLVYLDPQGAYLLDTGRVLVLWLSRGISADFMKQVFGLEPGQQEPSVLAVEPPRAGSELSARINRVIAALRAGRATHQQVFVVRQGSHMEAHVVPYFVEDRSVGTVSYLDFLQTLHKGVLAKA